MHKTVLAIALLSVFGAASSAIAADAPASPHTVTGNLSVVSDYRFRGVSQTFGLPAVQGGFDYAHSSGFYAGNWNSNVSGLQYANGAGLEMDAYAGFKTEVAGVGIDVGTLYYYYPGASTDTTNVKYDNQEVYLGLGVGPLSAKASYAITDYFGLNDATGGNGKSKGTLYYEVNFAKEVAPKLTVTAHVGTTVYKNYKDFDYTDYKVGAAYDLNGFALGLAVVGNTLKAAGKTFNTVSNDSGKEQKLYKTGAVLSLSKSF